MSLSRIVVLLVLWMASPLPAGAAPVVLVLGDSLSAAYGMATGEGWVALLQQRIHEAGYPHRVVNASASGETTRGGRERLGRLLTRHDPDVVVIELGGNDGLRGLPLDAMADNLAAMVESARAEGARVLLIGMRLPPNYGTAYTRRFQQVYRNVAERFAVPLVPFLLEGVAGNGRLMQADGIHAAAAAQPKLLANVWPGIEPLLRSVEAKRRNHEIHGPEQPTRRMPTHPSVSALATCAVRPVCTARPARSAPCRAGG